jgi:ribose transport system ATP-binding protein
LGVEKRFGETPVLCGVDWSLAPGEVHAVLGENGAGKSTLMKILSGALLPDRGQMKLDGVPYAPQGPAAARSHGVRVVYQEPWLCPHLTVAENLLLGMEPARFGWLWARPARQRVEQALGLLGTPQRPEVLGADRLVSHLSPAEEQLVAIARALGGSDCRILILDEPTSRLDLDDVERLFLVVRQLAAQGITVLYVSHFLDEVMKIADRYTVLRDGRRVGEGRVAESRPGELVALMAGERQLAPKAEPRARSLAGEVMLKLDRLGGHGLPLEASLTLRRGEVLGIGGLVGSGKTELLRAVFGLDPVRSGTIQVGAYLGPASPVRRLAQGLGLLSEDRAGEGLLLTGSIAENLTLSALPRWIWPPRERQVAERWIARLGIRCRGPAQRTGELSGGNQQKVALGRLLHSDLDVLLLDEPTRGIDVMSRAEVHGLVREMAARGKAVLVVSSHLPELLEVCDGIAVMRRGRLGKTRPASECSESSLLAEAVGA